MNTEDTDTRDPSRASRNVPKERTCLRCRSTFMSDGFGERICRRCKGSASWRNAAPASPRGSKPH